MSAVIGSQGRTDTRERQELRGALDGERELEPKDAPFSGHRLPVLLHRLQVWYADSKGGVMSLLTYARSLLSQ